MFKIIDNFLSKDEFKKLEYNYLKNPAFPYYLQNGKDYLLEDKRSDNMLDQYQFTHLFYDNLKNNSEWYWTLDHILKKLKVSAITKAKVNLNPNNTKLTQGIYHTDFNLDNNKTAVFYLNTCDGYTIFKKNKKKIESKANRVVIFDSKNKHAGTNTTNVKVRCVLNINYYGF
tara:strand:+ start:3544 stop:4059 length:516 start_codon:yes stop_codon:yes gene_type:complete